MGHHDPSLARRLCAGAAAVVALGAGSMATGPAALAASQTHFALDRPTAITAGAGHLWIANRAGNSVTELTYQGAFVRSVHGARYGFHSPRAIAVAGAHVFVLNARGSVTELSVSNGSLVRIVRGARYDFGRPSSLIVHGADVWVVDSGSAAVTEFRASDGSLVRVLDPHHNNRFGLYDPVAITAAGDEIWVLNATRGAASPNVGSLTEIAAATGALVRIVHGARLGLAAARGIAFDGTHLWVTDSATSSVTELTSSGRLAQVVTNASNNDEYGFNAPTAVTAHGNNVYVVSPPGASPMVTQIASSTALGMWYECNTNTPDPNFDNPTGVTVQGGHVWVVSPANNSLAELSTIDGSLVRQFA